MVALQSIAAAAADHAYVWSAYQALPKLEAQFGAPVASAVVATTLWDCVLQADVAFFNAIFELFFRAGGAHCLESCEQFLAERNSYALSYWNFVLLTKSMPVRSSPDWLTDGLVRKAGRGDLAPLFDVYLKQMRQAPVAEIVAAAVALKLPAHRAIVADYMADMGYAPDELGTVVASFGDLTNGSSHAETMLALMQARLANAEGRWDDVLKYAGLAQTNARFRHAAVLLRALALARLKKVDDATTLLNSISDSADASSFERARAAFIRVTTELVGRGSPLPEQRQPGLRFDVVGRPLAQSLWVGPELRWIERLSIKSYLDNGWRFQLYVYDEPKGVPKGCEILDAAAIIPAKDIFMESQGSGSHAGSIGAFSDLFRYALLYKRGGMWTDTDVINFKKFEPDGQRFICTEITDAGLVTLNGAMMAAGAGDEFVGRAYDRARELLSSKEKMFFTRIGPYLLAEVALELGVDSIAMMPPGFLSPISWMNTASLLQPFDGLMARQEFQQAINVHVYTEMWRTLGLGLERPPSSETFLGRLYADHFGIEERARERLSA